MPFSGLAFLQGSSLHIQEGRVQYHFVLKNIAFQSSSLPNLPMCPIPFGKLQSGFQDNLLCWEISYFQLNFFQQEVCLPPSSGCRNGFPIPRFSPGAGKMDRQAQPIRNVLPFRPCFNQAVIRSCIFCSFQQASCRRCFQLLCLAIYVFSSSMSSSLGCKEDFWV